MRRAILLLVLLGAPVCAQKPELQTDPDFRLRRAVDIVNVDVTVTDARGNFLRDLKRENFRVLEEGVEQEITYFSSIDAPAQVLVLVETSPAVMLIYRQHLYAAHVLLEGLEPQDWMALAEYDQSPRVIQIFTQQKQDVLRGLRELPFNMGTAELHCFQSIGTVLDWLDPVPGRKALVVLTTGLDTEQPRRWDALAEKLRAREVVVFPVALGGTLREFRETKKTTGNNSAALSFEQADRDLKEIARLTGGHAYFPKRAQDFSRIYREISSAVRHEYSLGFAPTQRDGKFHAIEVQVLDTSGRVQAPAENSKSGWRIRARQGYVAPKQ